MTYLLDTNVVSELRKANADHQVDRWSQGIDRSATFLSVITIREIEAGVLSVERRDPAQGAHLRQWLENQVLADHSDRILPVDLRVARRSSGLHVPDPRPERDALLGATALVHGLTVVTRNTRDFEPLGVEVFNPWLSA